MWLFISSCFSDELLLQEDGPNETSLAAELSNAMLLGSADSSVGIGRFNHTSTGSNLPFQRWICLSFCVDLPSLFLSKVKYGSCECLCICFLLANYGSILFNRTYAICDDLNKLGMNKHYNVLQYHMTGKYFTIKFNFCLE